MEKEIYKVGDEVYYYGIEGCLKGKVANIWSKDKYPIYVKFDSQDLSFTFDGRFRDYETPTLSFAPYDFVNGGFTQERTVPKIEVDTLVYVNNLLDKLVSELSNLQVKIDPKPTPTYNVDVINYANKLKGFTKKKMCGGQGCQYYYMIPSWIIDKPNEIQ